MRSHGADDRPQAHRRDFNRRPGRWHLRSAIERAAAAAALTRLTPHLHPIDTLVPYTPPKDPQNYG